MALGRYKALEEVRYGYGRQVGQLAGIEERASAGAAALEPDVRLLGIDESIHRAGATRASIAFYLVLFLAGLNIANVEYGSCLLGMQPGKFTVVKPQTVTTGTAIDFRAIDHDLFHIGPALGTPHRA